MASYKEKVEPEVSHHVIPDVVRVESDNKQTVEPKQVQMVPEEAKEHKVLENREKTSFQHWRSRLEHTVLDGDPGRKRLHSHEENQRKEGLSRLKRQPEILNPDIVLGKEDSLTEWKVSFSLNGWTASLKILFYL